MKDLKLYFVNFKKEKISGLIKHTNTKQLLIELSQLSRQIYHVEGPIIVACCLAFISTTRAPYFKSRRMVTLSLSQWYKIVACIVPAHPLALFHYYQNSAFLLVFIVGYSHKIAEQSGHYLCSNVYSVAGLISK